METKKEWYKKLAKKLKLIKIGELSLDDYIKEVETKTDVYKSTMKNENLNNSQAAENNGA